MSQQVTATFTFDSWDEVEVLDVEGARIVRTSFAKTFTGDLEGTSRGEMVMAHALHGSVAYTGYERIEAAIGRAGSPSRLVGTFILRHNAFMAPGTGGFDVVVMDSSGTGDLAGLSGTATIERQEDGSHGFTLDYEVPDLPGPASDNPDAAASETTAPENDVSRRRPLSG